MKLIKKTILLILCIYFCSCSNRKKNRIPARVQELKHLTVIPTNVKPAYQISFKKDEVYGSTKKVLIGSIVGLAVDSSGHVFISDAQQNTIYDFNPDGSIETHIGRKGRGPGEFIIAPSLSIISNRLYAYDPASMRVNIFSLNSLSLDKTVNLNPTNQNSIKAIQGYTITYLYPRGNSTFLVCFKPVIHTDPKLPGFNLNTYHQKYYLMNGNGKIISNVIFEQRGQTFLLAHLNGRDMFETFHFLSTDLNAIAHNGFIYLANSKYFLIKEYSPDGIYKKAYYYRYKKVLLSRKSAIESHTSYLRRLSSRKSEINRTIKITKRIIQQNTLPKTWPALHSIKLDNKNRLWISTIVKNMKVYEWWVLNQEGKLLARFFWPRNKSIEIFRNNYIYTLENNKRTGLPKIVRFKFQMNSIRNNIDTIK